MAQTLWVCDTTNLVPVPVATLVPGTPISLGTYYGNEVGLNPDGLTAYVTAFSSSASPADALLVVDLTAATYTAITMPGPVKAMAISSDGAIVAACSDPASGNAVYLVDTVTKTILATSYAGPSLGSLAVTPDGTTVLVGSQTDLSLSYLSTSTGLVTQAVQIPSPPGTVAISPDGSIAYVGMPGMSEIAVIDISTASISMTIGSVGSDAIAFNPDGLTAYTSAEGGIFVIDTTTSSVVGSITTVVDGLPTGIVFDPTGVTAYACDIAGYFYTIDVSTSMVTTTLPCAEAEALAITPTGGTVYVAGSGEVQIFDTGSSSFTGTITVGSNPTGVSFDHGGTVAYVCNAGDDTVSVIDVGTSVVTSTLTVGTTPMFLAIAPSGTVYVANEGTTVFGHAGSVSVIDPSGPTVSGTDWVGAGPMAAEIAGAGTVYVTGGARTGGNTMFAGILPTGHMAYTLGGFRVPRGLGVLPNSLFAYVGNTEINTDQVSVVDLTAQTISATITTGTGTTENGVSIVAAAAGTKVYVLDGTDSTTTVITTATNLVTGTVAMTSSGYNETTQTPDGFLIFASTTVIPGIDVITAASGTVTATITGLTAPLGMAVATVVTPGAGGWNLGQSSTGTVGWLIAGNP